MQYQGEISIRKALQLSLNVPAVRLLEAVGPARLLSKFKRSKVKTIIPKSERPGLAIGLGGIGISLRDLVQLYTAFGNQGRVRSLRNGLKSNGFERSESVLLRGDAAWYVADILSGAPPPQGSQALGIAYKTGTSYGYRDAWSVGFDGRYVLGVWVGRPDNGSVPGISGFKTAAPILFDAFARTGLKLTPFKPPSGVQRVDFKDLPVVLQRFRPSSFASFTQGAPELPPQIIYPPNGVRVELANGMSGKPMPLVLKIQDGRPPFRWLANGSLLPSKSRTRSATWVPDGEGYSTLTVVDAGGRANSISVYIDAGGAD
jgi:penicillin-binding protein 1C